MRTRSKKRPAISESATSPAGKRVRLAVRSTQLQPLSKQQRTSAHPEETTDSTIVKENLRHMTTRSMTKQHTSSSHTRFPPTHASQIIDLTLDEGVPDALDGMSQKSKLLPRESEEQHHPEYTSRSKKSRKHPNPAQTHLTEILSKKDTMDEKEENKGKIYRHTSSSADIYGHNKAENGKAKQTKKAELEKERNKAKDSERKPKEVQNSKQEEIFEEKSKQRQGHKLKKEEEHTALFGLECQTVMFTVSEAITALDQSPSGWGVAYDLPTGASLSYPVERSYHLAAMGRYNAPTFTAEI